MSSPKKALITGITGQDGSYLTELLLEKGYEVHGLIRRSSSFNTGRIDHVYRDFHDANARLFLHYGDLTDGSSVNHVLRKVKPAEIYHLGAQSHVRVSFDLPEHTGDVTGIGTTRILDAILDTGIDTRFYQASSSEMYGKVQAVPQNEETPFYPRSPYGAAKVYAYWMTVNYREAYQLHASNGILFNHESPRRGETFVTRKITRALAKILAGKQKELFLGNLDAKRDWGYAKDYVEAMWLMLQTQEAEDYVIATGETHTVREFLEVAFGLVGRSYEEYVKIDPRYFRPTEVDLLIGDSSKAKNKLGWKPKVGFKELVRLMVEADLVNEGMDPATWMKKMKLDSKIYVAGHSGLVGSALVRNLRGQGFQNIICRTSQELNLTRQQDVEQFFKSEKPEYAFIAAAKVGGIIANRDSPTEFLLENTLIALNVMAAAADLARSKTLKKLLFLGSSCIYPKFAEQPIKESSLLTGALEPTNEAYALAKIIGLKLVEYQHRQHGFDFISAMPANLYGPGDNFHPNQSHVIPGLLRRFHEAKEAQLREVTVWGTGMVLREFLHVDDLAEALIFLMQNFSEPTHINVGSGEEVTIKQLAERVAETVGYKGKLIFDSTKPDGTPRKVMDHSRIKQLGWKSKISLEQGLKQTYQWYLEHQKNLRGLA